MPALDKLQRPLLSRRHAPARLSRRQRALRRMRQGRSPCRWPRPGLTACDPRPAGFCPPSAMEPAAPIAVMS